MIVKIHMTRFARALDEIILREVTIPDDSENVLDDAYHYGQNDFQPQEDCPSASMGDVIELDDGTLHRVMDRGFEEISATGLDLIGLDAYDASWKE